MSLFSDLRALVFQRRIVRALERIATVQETRLRLDYPQHRLHPAPVTRHPLAKIEVADFSETEQQWLDEHDYRES